MRFSCGVMGVAAVAGLMVATIPAATVATTAEPVTRVEEDWVLVLNEPDNVKTSPQIHTIMSPFGHLDSYFAQALWNYREVPDFAAGGLQMDIWNGAGNVQSRDVINSSLSTTAETFTWTQVLSTDGNKVVFNIINGQSVTWGAFGGPSMKVQGNVYVANLNGYSADVSTAKSSITFGSNRVESLVLQEVRSFGASGSLLSVDNAPRVVFQRQD